MRIEFVLNRHMPTRQGKETEMNISIHNVRSIELCDEFPENSNSRTIRIVSGGHPGVKSVLCIVLYGNTDAVSGLPKSTDFVSLAKKEG